MMTERGLATLESAMVMVVVLPLVLVGVTLSGAAYDQSVATEVVYQISRESTLVPLQWRGSRLQADSENLAARVVDLANAGMLRAEESFVFSRAIGFAACYEVHRVNGQSGASDGVIESRCQIRGAPRSAELPGAFLPSGFVGNSEQMPGNIGILNLGSVSGEFLQLSVVLRFAVWAEVSAFGALPITVSAHRSVVPRQEVRL